jgi:hypothetical protein
MRVSLFMSVLSRTNHRVAIFIETPISIQCSTCQGPQDCKWKIKQMWWFFVVGNCSWVWLLGVTVFSSLFPLQLALLYCRVLQLVVRVYICFCICWSVVDNPLLTAVPFLWQFSFLAVQFYCMEIVKGLRSLNCIFSCKYVLWADPAQVYNLTWIPFALLCQIGCFNKLLNKLSTLLVLVMELELWSCGHMIC